jgi:hypothetical protein
METSTYRSVQHAFYATITWSKFILSEQASDIVRRWRIRRWWRYQLTDRGLTQPEDIANQNPWQ